MRLVVFIKITLKNGSVDGGYVASLVDQYDWILINYMDGNEKHYPFHIIEKIESELRVYPS